MQEVSANRNAQIDYVAKKTGTNKVVIMNFKLHLVGLVFLLISCKNEEKTVQALEAANTEHINNSIENTKQTKTEIPIYTANFTTDTTKNNIGNIAATITNLKDNYRAYPFDNYDNEFQKINAIYQSKEFMRVLAKGFNNNAILDLETRHYSFVIPKSNTASHYITIEVWQYPSKKEAKSVIDSLKRYKEAEIYFKSINWIWVHQENKIYLIFATSYNVKDPEMQAIKQAVIKTVSAFGDYETIKFYE